MVRTNVVIIISEVRGVGGNTNLGYTVRRVAPKLGDTGVEDSTATLIGMFP